MPTLLVVDDEPAILDCFRLSFQDPEVSVITAASASGGLEQFSQNRPDVVILDIDLPDQSGLDTFRQMGQIDPRVPAIFMTGSGTTATAIEAMALGAFEYLLKPLKLDQLRLLIARAIEVSRLMRVPAVVAEDAAGTGTSDPLVGRCLAMQEVYKSIGRVSPQNVTVLILGESGTGKELAARALYHYSRRSDGPFLAINCAAIPETLLESELFGHEKGAFTGAERKRIGKFEQCSGGTLFLDEIGDMTPLTQTKILRVLQDQQFERVGGNETIRTDVRVITATNRDLEKMAAAGQFRADLYYRLNVYTIRLPPLRERGDDLPLLADHFLKRFSRELGKEVRALAAEALELLRGYPWPGNLRELQSVLKQALLQATGPLLLPEHLPASFRTPAKAIPAGATTPDPSSLAALQQFIQQRLAAGAPNLYAECLAWLERPLFTQVLRQTGGKLSQAARLLGINRITLRSKLKALGMAMPDRPAAAE